MRCRLGRHRWLRYRDAQKWRGDGWEFCWECGWRREPVAIRLLRGVKRWCHNPAAFVIRRR